MQPQSQPQPQPQVQPQLISLQHPAGLALDLMDWGATWLSCRVPLADHTLREVILGCPQPHDYSLQSAYLGAMIGRYANRIAHASIEHHGQIYHLTKEHHQHHQLHGGPDGFHRRYWSVIAQTRTSVSFQLISADQDQGFPGQLMVSLKVTLSGARQITLDITATTTRDCPVSISHHAYFNLNATHDDARQQQLQIAADYFLPVDHTLLPQGTLARVDDLAYAGAFDFRQPTAIAERWLTDPQQRLAGGYDHAYLLHADSQQGRQPAAVLYAADQRLCMKLTANLPAMQLYTGQFLRGIIGRDGHPYNACSGVALEAEFLPDSPNHPEWPQPSCWLASDAVYRHIIQYDFEV